MGKTEKGFTLVEFFIVLWFVVGITLAGALLYVAFHFIAKFW